MKDQIDIMLEKGTLVTVNQNRLIVKDGAIAIKDGFIIDVGKSNEINRKYDPERIIDARGKVVTPGLVDSHVHLSS